MVFKLQDKVGLATLTNLARTEFLQKMKKACHFQRKSKNHKAVSLTALQACCGGGVCFFSGRAAHKWNFVDFTICSDFLQNGVVAFSMPINVVTQGQIQVSMESHEAESGRLSESTTAHNFQCCWFFFATFLEIDKHRGKAGTS